MAVSTRTANSATSVVNQAVIGRILVPTITLWTESLGVADSPLRGVTKSKPGARSYRVTQTADCEYLMQGISSGFHIIEKDAMLSASARGKVIR